MIEVVVAIFAGIAAHQTDRIVRDWPRDWEMLSRYIIGGLVVILTFALMLGRLNRPALKDGMLAIVGAFGGTGVGVALAYWLDEVKA